MFREEPNRAELRTGLAEVKLKLSRANTKEEWLSLTQTCAGGMRIQYACTVQVHCHEQKQLYQDACSRNMRSRGLGDYAESRDMRTKD